MGTCQTCGCETGQTVKTPIDRSLGFTAMLELYPGFGQMEVRDGEKITTAFLADWHASGHKDMYAYAREWVAAQAGGNPYAQYTPEHRVWEVAQRHGKNAAAWVVDGNTSQVSARGLLKGIEDGDPAVLDSITGPVLSNSPGCYSRDDLLADAGWVPHDGTDLRDELIEQYMQESGDATQHEVERLARNIIE